MLQTVSPPSSEVRVTVLLEAEGEVSRCGPQAFDFSNKAAQRMLSEATSSSDSLKAPSCAKGVLLI